MSYMVIFRTADGKPGYVPAEGVEEAVATVERLRNDDGADGVRIYRMEEVAFEYKVHYSVQITEPEAPSSAGGSFVGAAPAPVTESVAAVTDTDPASSELSWDDEPEASPPPFDQMAVDPAGTPRWDDSTEDAPLTLDDPEPVGSSDPEQRRGLFGR